MLPTFTTILVFLADIQAIGTHRLKNVKLVHHQWFIILYQEDVIAQMTDPI